MRSFVVAGRAAQRQPRRSTQGGPPVERTAGPVLVSRGLTSRAIGERLGLSVRTVDNHLARCFDKLGTRNRAELADLLEH